MAGSVMLPNCSPSEADGGPAGMLSAANSAVLAKTRPCESYTTQANFSCSQNSSIQ